MKERKWFIPVVVVSVLLIGGIVGGVVVAADDSSSNTESQTSGRCQELLDRACAIYAEETGVTIDSDQMKNALKQALEEMRDEALENRLQDLVNEGKITEEEAAQLLEWWQSRPEVELPLPAFGGPGPGGGIMQGKRFQQWGCGPCPVPDASAEANA
jgi:uncharacterized membrane protein